MQMNIATHAAAPAKRALRIGLLWHSLSSGNLGVGALTIANMAIARAAAEQLGLTPEFVVIGMRDGDAPVANSAGVESFILDRRSLLSPKGYWAKLRDLDCVLDIGAGDSFAEIYGGKRFLFLWLTKFLALCRGVPLILSPQTIGPFTRTPYRQLAQIILNRASAVVSRDTQSFAVARALAPRGNNLLAVDVAFELPFEDRSARRNQPKLRVGINASGLLCHEAESGRNRFGLSYDHARLCRRLIAAFAAMPDVEVHLVAHATSQGDASDDDGRCADQLATMFPNIVRVPDFAGPCEAKSYISGLDFLIAGRMHACIGAFSAGTPVIPIAYSRKFSGLFGMLDYTWLLPVSGMDDDQAFDFVMRGFAERAQLGRDITRGMTKVKALLDTYRGELASSFSAIAAK